MSSTLQHPQKKLLNEVTLMRTILALLIVFMLSRWMETTSRVFHCGIRRVVAFDQVDIEN